MATHKALVLSSNSEPLSLQTTPKPTVTPGSAIVRVLAAPVVPYMGEILSGKRPYPLSFPLVPGCSAIGRIDSVGPDSVSLSPGDLVFCDVTIRARDDPSSSILFGLFGGFDAQSKKLMDGEWRNATWAEYARFPLENLYPLNEGLLCGEGDKGLGYKIEELSTLLNLAIPMGGLATLGVQAGESVIVAPATGFYGGAAVAVALGLGARVVIAGRNEVKLKALEGIFGARVKSVVLSGDVDGDSKALMEAASGKGADAYIDFSPPAAVKSTHLVAALGALKNGGRAAFMGGIVGGVEVPYPLIMFKNLSIQGRFMFQREHVERLFALVESGLLKLGKDIGMLRFRNFGLEEWEEAVRVAAEDNGWGAQVLMRP